MINRYDSDDDDGTWKIVMMVVDYYDDYGDYGTSLW